MDTPKVDHFVGYRVQDGARVRFHTAGCGSCAFIREFEGEQAAEALRSFAASLRQRAEEAERLAALAESLRQNGAGG